LGIGLDRLGRDRAGRQGVPAGRGQRRQRLTARERERSRRARIARVHAPLLGVLRKLLAYASGVRFLRERPALAAEGSSGPFLPERADTVKPPSGRAARVAL